MSVCFNYLENLLNGNCYPKEIFLSPSLTSHFICPIDFGICRNPIIDQCGHTFGRFCLKKSLKVYSKCPLTNLPYKNPLFSEILALKAFLFSLEVRCLNFTSGCKWENTLEKLEKHIENECLFVPLKCLFCEKIFINKELTNHLLENHMNQLSAEVENKKEISNKYVEMFKNPPFDIKQSTTKCCFCEISLKINEVSDHIFDKHLTDVEGNLGKQIDEIMKLKSCKKIKKILKKKLKDSCSLIEEKDDENNKKLEKDERLLRIKGGRLTLLFPRKKKKK